MTPSRASAHAQRAGPAWPVRKVSWLAWAVDMPSGLKGLPLEGQHPGGGCGVQPATQGHRCRDVGLVSPGQSRTPESQTLPTRTFSECLPGHYGAGCQLSCSCRNGGVCDRLTGHCLCPAGWTGDKCQSREWVLGSWEVLPRATLFYAMLKICMGQAWFSPVWATVEWVQGLLAVPKRPT